MKPVLVIIAQEGFQDKELAGTRNGLEAAGLSVVLASTEAGACTGKFGSTEAGACTGKFGSTEQATIAVRDVVVTDYDRIAFIGGPGAHALAENFHALNVARTAVDRGVILGAICIAPTILAAAGVLRGKHATVWDSEGEQVMMLKKGGAMYVDEPVVVDGHIVTANGPEAAEEFGRRLAAMR